MWRGSYGAKRLPPFGLAPNGIADLAYDWRDERLWLCQQWWRQVPTFALAAGTLRLRCGDFPERGEQLPLANGGARGANTLAVDPVDPDVIYLGKKGDIYTSSFGVARSTDGGGTFGRSWWCRLIRRRFYGRPYSSETSTIRARPQRTDPARGLEGLWQPWPIASLAAPPGSRVTLTVDWRNGIEHVIDCMKLCDSGTIVNSAQGR